MVLCYSHAHHDCLQFFNQLVFPVYIIHLPIQQVVALFLFRVNLNPWVIFMLHLFATLSLSTLVYAFVLRPLHWLHPFFGIAPLKSFPLHVNGKAGMFSHRCPWPILTARFMTFYLVSPILVIVTIYMLMFSAISQPEDAREAEHIVKSGTGQPAIPLIDGVVKGNIDAVRQHIASGTDLNKRAPESGSTALIAAVSSGKTKL